MKKAGAGPAHGMCYSFRMDYIDFMLFKLALVCLLAFIGGLLGFFSGKE